MPDTTDPRTVAWQQDRITARVRTQVSHLRHLQSGPGRWQAWEDGTGWKPDLEDDGPPPHWDDDGSEPEPVAVILADGDRAHRPPEMRSQWRIAPCGHLTYTGYHRCGAGR